MKTRYSRVYRHHHRKQATTYIRSKQGRTFKGLANKKLSSYVQGSINKAEQLKAGFILYSTQPILYTEISLESFRMTLSRLLSKQYVKTGWCYQICKQTTRILRKHKLPQGGTVDRISMGMRLAYGTPFARAAMSDIGQQLVIFKYNPGVCKKEVIKRILMKSTSKLAKKLKICQIE